MMDGKQRVELIKSSLQKENIFDGKLFILPVYHMIFLTEIDLETHFSEAKIIDLSELIGEKGGKNQSVQNIT